MSHDSLGDLQQLLEKHEATLSIGMRWGRVEVKVSAPGRGWNTVHMLTVERALEYVVEWLERELDAP